MQVPLTLGEWEGEAIAVDPRGLEHLAGHWCRQYVNRHSGKAITVALVCGRPGPVSVHSPDVCYGASGYEVARPLKHRVALDPSLPTPEFLTAQFLKTRTADRKVLRIFWAWSADGNWTSPENPRLAFARFPMLYKLYLVREMADTNEPLDDDPCVEFMRTLLPELQKSLFPRQ
jgi:hypothetical protein